VKDTARDAFVSGADADRREPRELDEMGASRDVRRGTGRVLVRLMDVRWTTKVMGQRSTDHGPPGAGARTRDESGAEKP
jgi:hypothetical protein